MPGTNKMALNKGAALTEREDLNSNKDRVFERKLTVGVEIVGEDNITMMDLLRGVKEVCGNVIGCRFKAKKKYEITMSSIKGKERLMDGFKIKNSRILAKELANDELVVSFLNLPTYIEDELIEKKLLEWGVNVVSPIKRKMWPGTEIADGTRFVKVKFNEYVQSLPYSTKFETLEGAEYFRVIHDRQVRVCRLCIQPGHILRECPEFKCHKCGEQGHYARECPNSADICQQCKEKKDLCFCNKEKGSEDFFNLENMEEEEVEDEEEEVEEEETPAATEAEVEEMTAAETEMEESPNYERETAEGEDSAVTPVKPEAASMGSSMDEVMRKEVQEESKGGKKERGVGMGPPKGPVSHPALLSNPKDVPSAQLERSRFGFGRGRASGKAAGESEADRPLGVRGGAAAAAAAVASVSGTPDSAAEEAGAMGYSPSKELDWTETIQDFSSPEEEMDMEQVKGFKRKNEMMMKKKGKKNNKK